MTGPIPTVEDLAGDVVTDRFDDMTNPPGLTNHWAVVQVDHDVTAVQGLTAPPVSAGEAVTGQLYLDGRLARSLGQPVQVRWRPDRIERSTEFDGWRIETVTCCPPGETAVLVRIDVRNLRSGPRELDLGLSVASTATRPAGPWRSAAVPSAPNRLEIDTEAIIGRPDDRSAVCVQGIAAQGWRTTVRRNLIRAARRVDGADPVSLAYVVAIADDRDGGGAAAALGAYRRITADPGAAERASTDAWNEELRALFTPGNGQYSGSLPVLHTGNDALRRLYWWGALGTAWFRRDNPASVLGRTYDTLMPRYWQTTTFLWDYSLSSLVHALLDPAVMRTHILHWVGLDIDRHFGTEWLTGGPVGYWYSVNHYALTRLVHDYVRITGDTALLDVDVATADGAPRPMLEHLHGWAIGWQRRRAGSGLADYGEVDNLLECVGSYVHQVASLNAANVWSMRAAAGLLEHAGRAGVAADLRGKAADLLPKVLELYADGRGYFRARQPDGELVDVRHCYDFATVGTTIGADLPERMREEMADFFAAELQTDNWMRALSASDPAAAQSLRPDHQWTGAYPAWPPDAARALIALGHPERAAAWLDGLARTANQGPPGQAHVVQEFAAGINGGARKAPPQAPYLIDWACSSAGSWCELVISGIFGVQIDPDGRVRAGGCLPLVDPDARLEHLVVGGVPHAVSAGGVRRH